MSAAALVLWLLLGIDATAQELPDLAAEATSEVETLLEEEAGELIEASPAEAAEALLSIEARAPYWYEPVTDVFWLPARALAWAGLIGADHIDAAALTAWIGAVAAMAHRLWLALCGLVAPLVRRARAVLGLPQRATSSAPLERVAGLDEADQEYLRALVKRESDSYAATLRTETEILRQQLLSERDRTAAAVRICERLLGVSLAAAGQPPTEAE